MRATKRTKKPAPAPVFVSYDFQERTYQIDPDRRKVYRRFVEVETAKAVEIISSWRARHATT